MIIENCPWVTSTELINDIMVVNATLSNHGLHLDFSMDDTKHHNATMKVVSNCDNDIFIVDDELINTATKSFENKMKNRLRIIANRVEFLAFVVSAVLQMDISHMGKSFVAPIKLTDLKFECANKDRPASVSFNYNKDSDSRYNVSGGGVFEQQEYTALVQFRAWTSRIRIDASSIRIYELPKNVWFEIETESGYHGYIDVILYVGLSGEYDSLTLKEVKQVIADFSNMLEFARSY